jgi:peptide/nickel transport system substrate-binding protein
MDADFVVQHFICEGRYKILCNQEYDRLFKEQRAETDPKKRVELLKQMQTILHDEAAAGFTYQAPDIFGVGKRVKGFKPTADDVVPFGPITVQD